MIFHLATLLTPLLAEAPAALDSVPVKIPAVWEGVEIGSLGAIVVIGLLFGFLLRKFQGFRTDMSKEIKRELAAVAEAIRVEIQQPLSIKPHLEYTPLKAHEEAVADFNARLAAMSRANSEGREKIYTLIRENNEAARKAMNELERGLNERIDALPQRLIGVLSETKRIHDR